MEVQQADMEKVRDTLRDALAFFKARDEMNGAVHCAKQIRYSPLTTNIEAECERLEGIIGVKP